MSEARPDRLSSFTIHYRSAGLARRETTPHVASLMRATRLCFAAPHAGDTFPYPPPVPVRA
jgi:hypothetical protein